MRLAELQSAFQERILRGSATIESEIAAGNPEQRADRLRVYEHAYVTRLVEALARAYPVLRSTLGVEDFDTLAAGYVSATPSVHRSIRDYGAGLADRLETTREGEPGRALAELARWEWLLAEVFDAPDAAALEAAELSSIPADEWGGVVFIPHPTLRRWASSTNAVAWWRAERAAVEREPGSAPRPDALRRDQRTEWLVWRRSLRTMYRSMDAVEARAVDAMMAGTTFAGLCADIASCGDGDSVPQRAAGWLRQWIDEGVLGGLRRGS